MAKKRGISMVKKGRKIPKTAAKKTAKKTTRRKKKKG
jgi:hypothetical protein